MTLKHALAAAAGVFLIGLSGLEASTAEAQAEAAMDRNSIRSAVNELADLLEGNYVFPAIAREYAMRLRTRALAGRYDGLGDPAELARTLQAELRSVHEDAHLRISVTSAEPSGARREPSAPDDGQAIGDATWLAPGVGYFRISGLPSTDASVAQMTSVLDEFEQAQTLIIDLRRCPGGALREMDVLFSRLYAASTRVMIMDTRSDAAMPNPHDMSARLVREQAAPAGVTRDVHWAEPTAPVSSLADAQVFVLTGRTASACEHLAQALRETGRATLVGARTEGAGHFGLQQSFGGRFRIFLPVGNSYAPGAQSWEAVGVAPHREVAAEAALVEVLREINVPVSAAASVPPMEDLDASP